MSTTSLRGALFALTLLSCGGGGSAVQPADPSSPSTPVASTELAGPGGPAGQAGAPAGDPERVLRVDTPITAASKATFTAPAGWSVTEDGGYIKLVEPSGEARMWLIEIKAARAADATAALAAGWAVVQPGFALPVAATRALPAADGWEQRSQTAYVTPTAESRTVIGLARLAGGTWYLALIDGKNAALDRRGAQLNATVESFRAPNMTEKESFAGKRANVFDDARFEALAQFVEETRALTSIPGVALAVVHGGKIVYERGFGVRELGKAVKVTADTRFMIGSITKSLTTLMMARLVDAKKLGWDTPVAQLAPSFALGDAAATKALLLRHTVCACTGMPRRDLELIFEYENVTPEQRIASMKSMAPSTGFGETFQYSNLMVSAGGYIAAAASGRKGTFNQIYDAAMKAEVFAPLGMKSTMFPIKAAIAGAHATPHGRGLSMSYEKIPVAYEEAIEAVRPAGAAWSTARDLARYAALELGNGTLDGKVIVSKESLLARRAPQVKISETSAYGLGLFVENDRGVQIVQHGGNTLGFTASLFVLPEHDYGVVILTNAAGANAFTRSVRRRFLELAFDGKATAKDDLVAAEGRAKQSLDETVALIKPAAAGWMPGLVGKYHNADLGGLEVRKQGEGFVLDVGEWKSKAVHEVDLDKTAKLLLISPPFTGFNIVPQEADGKTTLVLDGGQIKYVFAPVAR